MKENFGIKSDEDITIKQYIDENVKNKEGENIKEDKHITLSFNNKVIVDKILDAPETFKITIDLK